jgi:hypothetical protein
MEYPLSSSEVGGGVSGGGVGSSCTRLAAQLQSVSKNWGGEARVAARAAARASLRTMVPPPVKKAALA